MLANKVNDNGINYYNMTMLDYPRYMITPDQKMRINEFFISLLNYIDEDKLLEFINNSHGELNRNEHYILIYLYKNREEYYKGRVFGETLKNEVLKDIEDNPQSYIGIDTNIALGKSHPLKSIRESTIYQYVCHVKKYLEGILAVYKNGWNGEPSKLDLKNE